MVEILDIVNKEDEIIGQAERKDVHEQGHICRMVYVCFYTPEKQVILQRRSLTKKSNPGRLTTTVSGHVESGLSYLEAAMRETQEETGVRIDPDKLVDLGVRYIEYTEGSYISNAMRALYLYEFDGDVADLKVEEDEGAGFELVTLDELQSRAEANEEVFVPFLVDSLKAGLFDLALN